MLFGLKSLFRKPRRPPTEEEMYAATTESLRRILPSCPTCLRSLSGHHYAEYAIAAGKDDMLELLAASHEYRWNDLRKIQTFNGLQDALDAFAIRCTERSGTLINTHDPYELYERKSIFRRYPLDSDEWLRLLEAAPDLKWQPF